MLIETCQLLCSAIWLSGKSAPYKLIRNHKHPSALWAKASKANWLWLYELGKALSEEFTYRSEGKIHKSSEVLKTLECPDLPDIPFTEPTPAMPDEYKCDSSLASYRRYYAYGKKYNSKGELMHIWNKRKVPRFIAYIYPEYVTGDFKENTQTSESC
jgi:hypothetical protein